MGSVTMTDKTKGIKTKPKFRIPKFVDQKSVDYNEKVVCSESSIHAAALPKRTSVDRAVHRTDLQLNTPLLISNGKISIHEGKIVPTIVIQPYKDPEPARKEILPPLGPPTCLRSNWKQKLVMGVLLTVTGVLAATHCKAYITSFLLIVEKESWITTIAALQVLFILVSFPVSWGFVLLLITSGYLYGVVYGPCVVMLLSGPGLVISHLSTQSFFKQCNKMHFSSEYIVGITTLVEGKSGWKIIALMRMTMIPYGIQNGIFALTGVPVVNYTCASLLGLFPMAFLNCYFGSTLKSLKQLSSLHQLEPSNFIVPSCQVLVTGLIMVFVLKKTKNEINSAMDRINENKVNNV